MIKHIVRTSICLFFLIMLSFMALKETSLAVTGTITVEKVTVPAGFGNFDFEITPGDTSFTLDDGDPPDSSVLEEGDYTITETDMPPGFDLTMIECTCDLPEDCDDVDLGTDSVDVTLKGGETIACVFTNTGNGTIIINKITVPAGGDNFEFITDIPGGPGFFELDDGQTQTFMNIPAGTYDVVEGDPTVDPGGFVLSDIVCDDFGTITNIGTGTATIDLDPNETITCTYTNTTILADLIIIKTDFPDPVVAGQELVYEIVIENNTNISITDVVLSDVLPAGVIPFSVISDPPGVCDLLLDLLEVDCDIGDLGPGEVVVIIIIVIPDPEVFNNAPTQIENIAILTAEPGSVMKQAITHTLVNPIVMIDVDNNKDNSTTVNRGEDFQLRYSVTTHANGANAQVLATRDEQSLTPEQRANALGVIFNLNFPAIFQVLSVQTTKGIPCTVNPGSIQCPLGNINEGQTDTVTINFRAPQEEDTYDFDSIVTSLLQFFENNLKVRVGSDNNCSIAPVGASPSIPLYLFIPLFIVVRRFWRRSSFK